MPCKETDKEYITDPTHWELLEDIHVRVDSSGVICIPISIIRHLNIKNKDKITIAIRHNEE